MNRVYLSKSRYCKCIQCEKILWLNKYKRESATEIDNTVLFENGKKVGELAKGLFGEYRDVEYNKHLTVMIEKTRELLDKKTPVITEASFTYDNNFCSVDILKNDGDGLEIYEVKSSTGVKDIYLDDAAYQYYVLSNLGYNVKKVAIVYINKKYVRAGQLEIDKLFNICDITEIARQKQDEIRDNIMRINEFMDEHDAYNEPDMDISESCFNPYTCEFWEYCTRDLPKPNIFDVAGMQTKDKFEKYYSGKISFEDLVDEDLNEKSFEQIDYELHDKEPKIEKDAIKELLSSLKYPLYFIDYESYMTPIPEVVGTTPYQQLPFQYSLHIITHENAPLEHREFLADVEDSDFIRHFAENMIGDMPEDGSVIVYNKSFEAKRNEEIAEMYPDLKDELERINGNIVDFMKAFSKRNYYTRQMQGSYSIKYVLPALYPNDPELDYNKLKVVHKGDEASEAFKSMKNKSKTEQEKIRRGLLEYCKLDTYAMVKIWEKFREVVDE